MTLPAAIKEKKKGKRKQKERREREKKRKEKRETYKGNVSTITLHSISAFGYIKKKFVFFSICKEF